MFGRTPPYFWCSVTDTPERTAGTLSPFENTRAVRLVHRSTTLSTTPSLRRTLQLQYRAALLCDVMCCRPPPRSPPASPCVCVRAEAAAADAVQLEFDKRETMKSHVLLEARRARLTAELQVRGCVELQHVSFSVCTVVVVLSLPLPFVFFLAC